MNFYNVKTAFLKEAFEDSQLPMVSGIEEVLPAVGNLRKLYNSRRSLAGAKAGSGHDCFLKGMIVQFVLEYTQFWTPQSQRYHWFEIVSSTSKMHKLQKNPLKFNRHVDFRSKTVVKDYVEQYNSLIATKKEAYINSQYVSVAVYLQDNPLKKIFTIITDEYNVLNQDFESTTLELAVKGTQYTADDVYFTVKTEYELMYGMFSNLPGGYQQQERVSTSYAQLKTIRSQRKHHKLKEDWIPFVEMVEELPLFISLIDPTALTKEIFFRRLKKIIPEDAYASYIDREVYNYGIYVNDHAIYWGMTFVGGVDIKILDYNFQSECHDILIGNHLVEFDGDFYCNYQLTKESI